MITVKRFLGECQICEGKFKTTADGHVALHGYKRPGDGHIRDRCPGEGSFAYERSRDMIPPMIELYKNEESKHRETLSKIERGTLAYFFESVGWRKPLVEVTPADPLWVSKLERYRCSQDAILRQAAHRREHYEKRYQNWRIRPLEEVDEEGRTAEHRASQEKRKVERAQVHEAKDEKARALALRRLDVLLQRRALLDQGGVQIRAAAARGDKASALSILRELAKKKHESTLRPSFSFEDVKRALERTGDLPANLPDLTVGSRYDWEDDLQAKDAFLKLGLADTYPYTSGVNYGHHLWR